MTFQETELRVDGNQARARTTKAFPARFHNNTTGIGIRVGQTMTILEDKQAAKMVATITTILESRPNMKLKDMTIPIRDDLGNTVETINLNDTLRAVVENLGQDHQTMTLAALGSVEDFPDEYKTLALVNTIAHLAGALDEALKTQDEAHSDMREVIKGIVRSE